MKTKKDYLENYASYPELAEKVLKAGKLSWKDICEMRQDAYNPSSGAVPGMIYYEDTVKFVKRNLYEVLRLVFEYQKENDILIVPTECEDTLLNFLAWFCWEYTMGEVLDYLEEE